MQQKWRFTLQAPERFQAIYASDDQLCPQRKMLQSMVSVIDELVLNLTQKLNSTHIGSSTASAASATGMRTPTMSMWDNTIFVFASDNGGDPTVGGNSPLKAGKATLFEGGVRSVSFVYSELLTRAQRGRNLTTPLHITDIYSTFCGRAGVDAADDRHEGVFPIDSIDVWDIVTGANAKAARERGQALVLGHEFNLTVNGTVTTMGALIHDEWKLIVGPQGYADFRGERYPCEAARPAANCAPNCLFNCKRALEGLRCLPVTRTLGIDTALSGSLCVSVCLCVFVAAVVPVHATVASDPHEHVDRSADPTAASQLEALLAMYRSETSLYQNVSTDMRGFDAAVRRRGGYMGPWT